MKNLRSTKLLALTLAAACIFITSCGGKTSSSDSSDSSSQSSSSSSSAPSKPVEKRKVVKQGEKIDKGFERNDDTI
ncbi:MAG: hypothetical protein RR315_06915, partial [Oscillospiraceae bacterium]